MNRQTHTFDFCVVGGGMAGLCAAIAAAREGAKTAIVQDRPVFGGNSSSEMRVHICGADRHGKIPNVRETGILEELRLENQRRNSQKSYSIWDTILYEKVLLEPNLKYFLNCSVLDAEVDGSRIVSVTGWQLTTYTYHTIKAHIFADCSGDGVLAPLTGAEYRIGREAKSEFNESHQPEIADKKTMGMTCLFQARNMGSPQPFEPPSWAYDFPTEESFPYRWHGWIEMGYWWIELGGEQDSIADTESIRDELLKIVFGVWDHIKNHGDHGAENYALDWVQFLPAKRESRRYVGDLVLTQNDIEREGRHFEDIVCYGGWQMDDHHPSGFWYKGEPTVFYPTPSPYGIPYRCFYSKNIENLMFAGRCASYTHAALSSARVQATGAVAGQAVGTAAAIACREKITPREVGKHRIDELQQSLLRQDAYLPWVKQRFSELTTNAKLSASCGDPTPLLDGINRPVGDELHAWTGRIGSSVEFVWDTPRFVQAAVFIFDSSLDKLVAMSHHGHYGAVEGVPETIVKDFRLEVRSSGDWQPWRDVRGNYQRLIKVDIGAEVGGVRAIFDSTWGSDAVRVFAFYLE
ncbi:MAG: FAD-dependent oxidoreductase [Armatimonadetes bacterium]|nr:FAD-dependent oxidoreductase [Armatimonadota bacterium]